MSGFSFFLFFWFFGFGVFFTSTGIVLGLLVLGTSPRASGSIDCAKLKP